MAKSLTKQQLAVRAIRKFTKRLTTLNRQIDRLTRERHDLITKLEVLRAVRDGAPSVLRILKRRGMPRRAR